MFVGQFRSPSPGRFSRQDLTNQSSSLDELSILAFWGEIGSLSASLALLPLFTASLDITSLVSCDLAVVSPFSGTIELDAPYTYDLTIVEPFTFDLEVGDMAEPLYQGTTKTIRLNNLNFIAANPASAATPLTMFDVGESVMISVETITGASVISPQQAVNGGSGNNWFTTILLPPAGRYLIKVAITTNAATEVFYAGLETETPYWAA